MLFAWTPEMEAKIHIERSKMLVGSREYTAVHLRTAGAVGDSQVDERGNPLSNLLGALYCARELGHPTVIVATHPALRVAVSRGWFDRTFASGPSATQIAHAFLHGEEHHEQTFIELGVMSQAKCIIANRGGFAETARWLGGNTECVRWIGLPPNGKPPGAECFAEFAASIGASTSWV